MIFYRLFGKAILLLQDLCFVGYLRQIAWFMKKASAHENEEIML
jgi:hypothetical protein